MYGGVYHELIRRNIQLPYVGTETFETAEDHIPTGKITVACSTSPFDPPIPLAELEVAGIQMAEAGVPKARVTMHLDEQLRGKVTMRDIVTGALGQCDFNGDIFPGRLQ